MTDRELFEKALEALELLAWYENPATKVQVRKPRNGGPIVTMYPHKVATEAAAPLRERLAQPEQEPVAWVTGWHDGHCVIRATNPSAILPIGIALYTAPQPETVIDKSAARRIATALGWEPPREEQEQEPVACKHQWFSTGAMELGEKRCIKCGEWNHTTPPRREWQGLTDEEIVDAYDVARVSFKRSQQGIRGQQLTSRDSPDWHYAKAIEAKLKEKNA